MTPEHFSASGFTIALLLPWLVGAIWLRVLLAPSGRLNIFITLGAGYFLGLAITTVLIRVYDLLFSSLNFWAIAAVLAALAAAGVLTARRQQAPPPAAKHIWQRWEVAVTAVLLGLVAMRYSLVIQELLLRPLFPWDAWMNWVPKALVWFHSGHLSEWVSPDQWLVQSGQEQVYTLGGAGSWRYPPTVPLIVLWNMLGAQIADHNLLYLPWLIAPLALACAMYGYLRLSDLSPVLALACCYAMLSLPFINVHTMLAGYADLWLAAAFALGTFALGEYQSSASRRHAVLCAVFALLCVQTKLPGLILGGILLGTLACALTLWNRKVLLVAGGLATLILLFALTTGIYIPLPGDTAISLSANKISLPYIGSYHLNYHPVEASIADGLVSMINWNLSWYLILPALVWVTAKQLLQQRWNHTLTVFYLGLAFLLFTFLFSHNYKYAENFTTLNRAFLYLVPAAVFIAVQLSFELYRQHLARRATA